MEQINEKYATYGKTVENLRNRIDGKQVNNKKGYLKCTPKPSYMFQKIFCGNLVAIRKSKLALKLSKPAYIGMCISNLSKVCKNSIMIILQINMKTNLNYYSQALIVQCMKLKLKMLMRILAAMKNV